MEGAGGAFKLLGRAGNGVRDGSFGGVLEVRPGPSGLMAVNALDLESYVRGVVAGESPSTWPARRQGSGRRRPYVRACDAQAGDRIRSLPRHPLQVYNGVAGERATTDAAVAATAAEVVTYAGKPVATYFFSTSGGLTENVENSFLGSTPQPWLRSVEDPYDDVSPRHRWGPYRWSFRTVKRKLGSLVKGSFAPSRVAPRRVAAHRVGDDRGEPRLDDGIRAAAAGAPWPLRLLGVLQLPLDERHPSAGRGLADDAGRGARSASADLGVAPAPSSAGG